MEHSQMVMPEGIPEGSMNHASMMAGIPDWLYYASIVIVMLVSFILLETMHRKPGKKASNGRLKFELTRFKPVKYFFRSRAIQLFFQLSFVFLFGVVLFAGFYGDRNPGRNIAPTLTWNIWWVGLIFVILFFGKMFCYACPWDAVTSWLRRMSFLKIKNKEVFNLGLKWPRYLKNIYPAMIFFIALTWIELGYRVTLSPEKTAILGLIMFGMVFIPGLIFEKKSFCKYGCLVGRVSGLYAMFAPVEIRSIDLDVCRKCKTVDCFRGNGSGYACPTGMNLKTMNTNTYCIMCAECFRTCKYDNVALNIRPFSHDLMTNPKPRLDEAFFALTLFALTAFHGLTMTPVWRLMTGTVKNITGAGEITAFSIAMAVCIVIPVLVFYLFSRVSYFMAGSSGANFRSMFIKYSYSVIPIALFYHVAHNFEHFVVESQKLIVLISDPFGFGWNIFGTADVQTASLFPVGTIWFTQVFMIVIGHVFGIYISHRYSYQMFKDRKSAIKSQIPMIVMMILFSILSLWLIAQPMEMRTAM